LGRWTDSVKLFSGSLFVISAKSEIVHWRVLGVYGR